MAKERKEKINSLDFNNKEKIYKNTKGYQFKVIDKNTETVITKTGNKRWNVKYLVKFESGYETWSSKKEIDFGTIKDWLSPYVCNIGIVGLEIENPQSHYLYDRWRDMIRRCYDETANNYKTYGAIGCIISEEWKYFPNFVRDMELKENCEKLKNTYKNPNERYELDKDLIKKGNKVYCNEYTCIVPHLVNLAERNERHDYNKEINSKPILQFDFSFNFIKKYDSISDAGRELNHSNTSGISCCCNNKQLSAFGYLWRYYDETKTIDETNKELKDYVSKYYQEANNQIKSKLINLGLNIEILNKEIK